MVVMYEKTNKYPVNTMIQAPRYCPLSEPEQRFCFLEEVADCAVPRVIVMESSHSFESIVPATTLDGDFHDSFAHANSSHRLAPNFSPMLEQEVTSDGEGRSMRRNSKDRFKPDVLMSCLSSNRPLAKPVRMASPGGRLPTIWIRADGPPEMISPSIPMLEQEETSRGEGGPMRKKSEDRFEHDLFNSFLSSSRPLAKPVRVASPGGSLGADGPSGTMPPKKPERLPYTTEMLPHVKSGKLPDFKRMVPPHKPLRQVSAQTPGEASCSSIESSCALLTESL
jgi:hypothetical protein